MQLSAAEKWASGFSALVILVIIILHLAYPEGHISSGLPDLRAILEMDGCPSGRQLICGYHYDLLEECTSAHGARMDVRLSRRLKASLDSLRSNAVDMVMIPACDTLQEDSAFVFFRVDSCGIWVFHSKLSGEAERVATWLRKHSGSDDNLARRQQFYGMYDPFKADSASFISPYDELVKSYADTLGWDWRLLSALIYKESRFHIESHSKRGASGLMQIMQSTARHYGCGNTLDPEENLRAGTALLMKLDRRYRDSAPNLKERQKIVLAAFNAGSGRIDKCMKVAAEHGLSPGKWNNLVEVIPEVEGFKGTETISFVSTVTDVWKNYSRLFPEESR